MSARGTGSAGWVHAAEVVVVDLDLDVCRTRAGGRVFVDDEDEFAAHRARYSYPPDVVAHATASADWLRTALGTGAEPFAGHYRSWLDGT